MDTSSDTKPQNDLQIEYGGDESPESIEYKKREAALVWKLDCYIAPVMMLLMLISYLDRGNVYMPRAYEITMKLKIY